MCTDMCIDNCQPSGCRWVFYTNSLLCASFAILWLLLTADSPRHHSGCSEEEASFIEADSGPAHGKHGLCSLPWKRIMRTPAVLVLFINHWVSGWAQSILSWTPTWLSERLHLDIKKSGFVSALPPLVGIAVAMGSGVVATHVIVTEKLAVGAVRKICQCGATIVAAVPLLLMVYTPDISAPVAVTLMIVSIGLNSLVYSGMHINHIDLTPKYAPLLYGVTNAVANTSLVIAPALDGYILGKSNADRAVASAAKWQAVFTISAAVQCFGGVLWLIGSSGNKQDWG